MENSPKISIVMASYNYEELIVKGIESVISQTYTNWELIIVDDASSDNSVNVIKKYSDNNEKIFLFHHPNNINKGLKETLKLALSKASGDYVAFLESDDCWDENNLMEKVNLLKEYPSLKFIFNDVNLIGDEDNISKLGPHFINAYNIINAKPFPRNILPFFSLTNLVPTFSCVLIEKEVVKKCDFDPPIDALLDIWLWAQISLENDVYYIDKKLTNWTLHSKSYLNTSDDVQNKKKQKVLLKELFRLLHSKVPVYDLRKHSILLFSRISAVPRINKLFRAVIRKIALSI